MDQNDGLSVPVSFRGLGRELWGQGFRTVAPCGSPLPLLGRLKIAAMISASAVVMFGLINLNAYNIESSILNRYAVIFTGAFNRMQPTGTTIGQSKVFSASLLP